jgi:hypothetical protein
METSEIMKTPSDIKTFLIGQPKGLIPLEMTHELISMLSGIWDQFVGSDETRMTASKLSGRAEKLSWDPSASTLEFEIERHGATVKGSSRAEIQNWVIDLKDGTAHQSANGYIQLRKQNPPLSFDLIVTKLVEAVVAGPDHNYKCSIVWGGEDDLRIIPNVLVPPGIVPQATFKG